MQHAVEAIREVDKDNRIVVNGRLARFADMTFGDYRNTGDRAAHFYPVDGYWESIPATNESYGFSLVDTVRKPAVHFVRLLASAASKGGNILMNVGPMGNGKWNQPDIDVFKKTGDWLKIYGEAIYGTTKTDLPIQTWGVTTQKGDITYLHVYDWPKNNELIIGGLTSDISNAWIISDKDKKEIESARINDYDVKLKLTSGGAPDTMNTVIALTLKNKKESFPVRLLDAEKENILYAFDATLNSKEFAYGDEKPNRNYVHNWKNNEQNLQWTFRLNQPANYKLYIQYNTATAEDKGFVSLVIGDKTFDIPYIPFREQQGTNIIYVGDVQLIQSEHLIRLNAKEFQGGQYMRPVALKLVNVQMGDK
jgi:hypothetical protein